MKTQKLKNLLLNAIIPFLLSLILFSSFKCLAKEVPEVPDISEGPTIINIINMLVYVAICVAIYFIINAFFLRIGCLIIKQKVLIKSWRSLKYILLAAIGGLLITVGGLFIGVSFLNKFQLFKDKYYWMNILIIFLILIFYNYWLSRRILNLSKKQAIFIGTIMGFLYICLFLLTWYLIAHMLPTIE